MNEHVLILQFVLIKTRKNCSKQMILKIGIQEKKKKEEENVVWIGGR